MQESHTIEVLAEPLLPTAEPESAQPTGTQPTNGQPACRKPASTKPAILLPTTGTKNGDNGGSAPKLSALRKGSGKWAAAIKKQQQLTRRERLDRFAKEHLMQVQAFRATTMQSLNENAWLIAICTAFLFAHILLGVAWYVLVAGWTVLDAVYFWSVTITTVGYGDVVPTMHHDKLFTCVYLMFGGRRPPMRLAPTAPVPEY